MKVNVSCVIWCLLFCCAKKNTNQRAQIKNWCLLVLWTSVKWKSDYYSQGFIMVHQILSYWRRYHGCFGLCNRYEIKDVIHSHYVICTNVHFSTLISEALILFLSLYTTFYCIILGIKPHTCDLCGKRFAKKYNLSSHKASAHQGRPNNFAR